VTSRDQRKNIVKGFFAVIVDNFTEQETGVTPEKIRILNNKNI
jgi:hypothetical protein